MAHFFEKRDRNVIPNWRSFTNTVKLKELNGIGKELIVNKEFKPDLTDLIGDWEYEENIGIAGDLIGAAITLGITNQPTVEDAAKFVMKNKDQASPELIKAAQSFVEPKTEEQENKIILISHSIEQFKDPTNLKFLFNKIGKVKGRLKQNPRNSILWVELARLYSIIGQDKPAERAIRNATFLSPTNRFVLRAMARFFVHVGNIEFAHDIIRKSEIQKKDPWLLATEISLASMRGRGSKFTKLGKYILESKNFSPFSTSELASAIATLELENDNFRRSRDFFKMSLLDPNDNALAQAEWASQEDNRIGQINPSSFGLKYSFEAFARDSVKKEKWQDAIDFSKLWFLDMPFSRGPILFGSKVASKHLKDHQQAVEITKAGLTSHPKNLPLFNNIVYFLCLTGKLKEAEGYLKRIRAIAPQKKTVKIYITATTGLYYFRRGFPDLGRKLYLSAMEDAKEEKNMYLFRLAFVNYAREEVLAGNEIDEKVLEKMERVLKNETDKEINDIKNEVVEMVRKKKEGEKV